MSSRKVRRLPSILFSSRGGVIGGLSGWNANDRCHLYFGAFRRVNHQLTRLGILIDGSCPIPTRFHQMHSERFLRSRLSGKKILDRYANADTALAPLGKA
jgi:hypothetical protein